MPIIGEPHTCCQDVDMLSNGVRVSELAFFPFTTSLRFRMRINVLLMTAVICAVALVQGDREMFLLGVLLPSCDVPIEMVFFIVRRRRAMTCHNGEDRNATVVKKLTYPMGGLSAVVIRYSAHGTVIESSRRVPLRIWLRLRVGDSVHIRIDREQATSWVFRWEEEGSADSDQLARED